MRVAWTVLLLGLILNVCVSSTSEALPDSVPGVIESFVVKQFPDAGSHFWVVNGAQWQAENELVVDFNAVVTGSAGQPPIENRYLLLIVSGKLAAAHHIPLDAAVECQPERA